MRRLLVFCLLLPCWLSARELVIGGILEPPLKWLDAQGHPRGLDVDLVTAIFGTLHTPIRIELIDSGARLTRNAESGFYDLLLTQGEIVNILLKIKNSFLPTKQILIGL